MSNPLHALLAGIVILSLTSISSTSEFKGRESPTPTPQSGEPATLSPTPEEGLGPRQGPLETPASPSPLSQPSATEVLPSLTAEPPEEPALALPRLRGEFAPNQVLVRIRRRGGRAPLDECFSAAGASVQSEIRSLSTLVLEIPEGTVPETLARLSLCQEVLLVEPNYLVHMADTIPADAGFGLQYGLVNIRAPQGWDLTTGAPTVNIAILDTGVDGGHPDLGAKIVSGYDFVNDDSSPADDNGHGTHVAGIAAAITNNGTGVAGVSWGAGIMPIKVLNAAGNGTFADVAAGIVWAADNGAQIINLSLGGSSPSSVLQDAVDYAYGKGAVLVAASGNTGANFVLYPARYPHVIAVGATNSSNIRSGLSNYGPELDLVAPGVKIYSTRLGGAYGYLSGTSMSAGYVSGLAAILRGIPGIGSPEVIAWEMQTTALDLGAGGLDDLYGHGLIQMDHAILFAMPPAPEPDEEGEASAVPPVYGGGPLAIAASPTPGPIQDFSPTAPATHSATAAINTPPTPGTPEVWALGGDAPRANLQTPTAALLGDDWPLGCGGLVLVLLGAILAWRLSRRKHPPRHLKFSPWHYVQSR